MVKWREADYRKRMMDWAEKEIGRALSFTEVKDTDMSLVLKAEAPYGSVYLKTGYAGASFEAALTSFLSAELPGHTGGTIAEEPAQNWLLMRGIKGEALRSAKDEAVYKRAIVEWADFQQRTIPLTGKFLSLGVPDRRLSVLKQEISDHLEAMCATGLSGEETSEVLALKPELLSYCDELDGIIPDTLDHGDLHSANISMAQNNFAFFDWGDAAVTHPFLSVRVFWNSLGELLEEDDDKKWMAKIAEFRPVYLQKWREFAPEAVLIRQLQLAEQIGCVYRALSWHLYINPHRMTPMDSAERPAQWLQLLLLHRKLNVAGNE